MRRELLRLFKPKMPRTPVPCYFVSAMSVKGRECKAKEKESTATGEGSGWLCENERTKERGSGGRAGSQLLIAETNEQE